MARHDVAVIGAGIVGLATARELLARRPALRLVVVDAAERVGAGQTSHNSGVIHAGVYYAPGSLKARLCVQGARALYAFCDEHGIAAQRCGKLIIARSPSELGRLDDLEARARANGVPGLRRLRGEEITEVEPHAVGVAALHSPATGIVDFSAVAARLADDVLARGGELRLGRAVRGVGDAGGEVVLRHAGGDATVARRALFCAGRGADRLAVAAGAPADPRIVPFRGRYLQLREGARDLVRGLIYPVPDPALPFLGVHLTRHVSGAVWLGPTALLAGGLRWPGTWRVMRRHWRAGARELRLAAGRRALAAACAEYVPALTPGDVRRGFAGVRAQAVARDGTLLDDFAFSRAGATLHVRNAPSPAATSALAIAEEVASRAQAELDL
ncbi:MAG: L-2-hydroxyglutarate oxidase [Solirubrobacteraceae bacterium]